MTKQKRYSPKPEELDAITLLTEKGAITIITPNEKSAKYGKERFSTIFKSKGCSGVVAVGYRDRVIYLWMKAKFPFRTLNDTIKVIADENVLKYNPAQDLDRNLALDTDLLTANILEEKPRVDVDNALSKLVTEAVGEEEGNKILNEVKGD